ncbi:MAG: MurR/RpiR family transcriptional regulator [Spirochaetes bacterium]|nr:MurR/RpiR family transcriptional regulator [Spirochaetota bacterium]
MSIDTEWAVRVSKASSVLTKSDRLILSFITSNPQDAAFLSLKGLTEKTGTSKPTVIEFYKKLGYTSFKEFLTGVRNFYEHHIDSYRASSIIFKKVQNFSDLIASLIETEIHSIMRLKNCISEDDLSFLSNLILTSGRVYIFGPGTGYYPAHFLFERLKRYKIDVHFVENNIQHIAEELYPVNNDDLLLVFNYLPEPAVVEKVMHYSRDAGASVVLITGSIYLSLASYSDRVIYINRGEIEFKNSMAVPMAFANLVLLAVELAGGEMINSYLKDLEEKREEYKLLFS